MTEIRPDYYKSGGLEAFDVIDAFELDFNLGNTFKYIARAGKKGDKVEDLRKAVTYLNREIEKEEKPKKNNTQNMIKMSVKEGQMHDEAEIIAEELKAKMKEISDYEAGRQENL